MPKKDTEVVEVVGYYRARNLSIFSLFKLSKRDAAELLGSMEYVDKEYCQNINIVQFSEVFCPKYKSGFQALWRKYVVLFNVSRNVDNGIVAAYMKSKNAAEVFDYSATYVELLSFLFFLVSVDKKSSFAFLFWIYFTLNEEPPTKITLVEFLESLWGAENHKESKKHRVLIKQAVKHIDLSDFDQKKFRIYDWKCSRGYTIPFHNLQREILRNIGSSGLWNRVKSSMREVIDDPDLIAARMGEKKKPVGRMKSCRIIGDRRDAWFELCDFVEAFLRYHEMVDYLVIEPNGVLEKAFMITSHAAKVSFAAVQKAIKNSTRKPVAPEAIVFNDDLLDDQSLTKLYKSALKVPVDKLFSKAEKKKDRAYEEIEKAEEELEYVLEYDPDAKVPVSTKSDVEMMVGRPARGQGVGRQNSDSDAGDGFEDDDSYVDGDDDDSVAGGGSSEEGYDEGMDDGEGGEGEVEDGEEDDV